MGHVERASRLRLDLPIQLGNWSPCRRPRQAPRLGQGREEVGQSLGSPPSPEAWYRWCRHRLQRRHLRHFQRWPYRLLRGRSPPVRVRRRRPPHRDGEARRRRQALRRPHPRHHEEVNVRRQKIRLLFLSSLRLFYFFFFHARERGILINKNERHCFFYVSRQRQRSPSTLKRTQKKKTTKGVSESDTHFCPLTRLSPSFH